MGILRLLLAIAVLASHTAWQPFGIPFFPSGAIAVETFFLLSGFYMALVIRTKYQENTFRFYKARFVRLFPLYWIALSLSAALICLCYLMGYPMSALVGFLNGEIPLMYKIWALVANMVMFSSEYLILVGREIGLPLDHMLSIPVVWSLGTELTFYLLAPYLFRKDWRLTLICFLGGYTLRLLIWAGSDGSWTPWNYYFTPATFHLFCLGGLSLYFYEYLSGLSLFQNFGKYLGCFFSVLIWSLVLFYEHCSFFSLQDIRYYLVVAISIPFMFQTFQQSILDRRLGDYCYPLYIFHCLVEKFYAPLRHYISPEQKGLVVLILSMCLCFIFVRLEKRVVKYCTSN